MHDLEIREDGTAAFVAVREPGWHGLGTVMQDDVTMEEALLIASMRYTYELAPVFVDVDGLPVQVSGERQAVLRRNIDVPEDVKAFGGGLSTKFKPHSLLDLWGWAEDLLGHGASVETVGNLKDGAHSFATIKLPGTALEGSETTQMYLTVSTGHDGTKATTATVSPVRVVCSNTLAWSNSKAQSKAKVGHRVALDSNDADQTAQILGIMREQQDLVDATFATLKAITLRPEDIGQVVSDLFPIPEEIASRPYADLKTGEKRLFSLNTNARESVKQLQATSPYRAEGSDGWSLYNAVVEYADYFSNVKGDDLAARRAERVMTGKTDDLKARALDLILV